MSKSSNLSAVLGKKEARRETYQVYGERALDFLTQQCAKSFSSVSSSSRQQARTLRGFACR